MAIIYSYPKNINIQDTDIIVGTSTVISAGKAKIQTKSFPVIDLATYINSFNPPIPTQTSELINDGADGINPFITAEDLPPSASTLDEVLANGNVSIRDAKVGKIYVFDTHANSGYPSIGGSKNAINFYNKTNVYLGRFASGSISLSNIGGTAYATSHADLLTASREYRFPDQDGIFALTSDIPTALGTLNDVLVNGNTSLLDAKIGELYLYDTTELQYGKVRLYDSNFGFYDAFGVPTNVISRDGISFFRNAFEAFVGATTITASRAYQLPDASGTIALLPGGNTTQYIRGDFSLATFPVIPAGGTWGTLNYPTWVSNTPFVKMTAAGTFSLDTTLYYPSSNPAGYTSNVGTVSSVYALTLGTLGTDLSSTVTSGSTTPLITLNVPTASSINRGALSPADWITFNGKQNALNGTGFVKISGTTISYDNSIYYLASNPTGFITSSSLTPYLLSSTAASTYYPIPTGTTSQYIRGDGTLSTFPTAPTITPSALTKTDDTNVTLTLGGTPATALLQATSLTLGWTGTLADPRIASASVWNAKFDLPSLTNGSVLFSNGATIAQNNANFFWDDATNRLGIGTTTPASKLDVIGDALINGVTVGAGPSNNSTNTVVGFLAASSLTSAFKNIFIGQRAGQYATDCNDSNVIGGYLTPDYNIFNESETLSIEKPDVALNGYLGESASLPHIWSPRTVQIKDGSVDVLVRMKMYLYSSIFMEYNLEDLNGNMRAGSIKAIWNADASTIKVTEETTDSIGTTSGCVIELIQDGSDVIVRFTNTNGYNAYCNTTSRILIRPIIQTL